MSDVVLLRKLAEKSTLKFGIYSDVPIYNLLDLKRYSYLRWVYYNSSNITFLDSILKLAGLKLDRTLFVDVKSYIKCHFLVDKNNCHLYILVY